MGAGLEFINDSGITIIDENYTCLALRAAGYGVANNMPSDEPDNGGGVQFFDVYYAGSDLPVMVLHKPQQGGRNDVGAGLWGARRNGDGSWTFRIGVTGNPNYGGVDQGCYWYIFDRPPPVSVGGCGFEVYNGGGQLVFSSMYRPMKVAGLLQQGGYPGGKYGFCSQITVQVNNNTIESDPDSHGDTQYTDIHKWLYTSYYSASDGVYGASWESGISLGHQDFYPTGNLSGGGGVGNVVVNLNGI